MTGDSDAVCGRASKATGPHTALLCSKTFHRCTSNVQQEHICLITGYLPTTHILNKIGKCIQVTSFPIVLFSTQWYLGIRLPGTKACDQMVLMLKFFTEDLLLFTISY